MARRYDSVSGADRRSSDPWGPARAQALQSAPAHACRLPCHAEDDHLQPRGAAIPSRVSAALPLAAAAHRPCPPLPLLTAPSCSAAPGMPWRPSPMPAPASASWPRMAWCWQQRSVSQARCGGGAPALPACHAAASWVPSLIATGQRLTAIAAPLLILTHAARWLACPSHSCLPCIHHSLARAANTAHVCHPLPCPLAAAGQPGCGRAAREDVPPG